VLDIKIISLRGGYCVTYVDYAYNLFEIKCTAASFGYGLKWSDKQFVRRLSDGEIADLRAQSAYESVTRQIQNAIIGKVQTFRENTKLHKQSDANPIDFWTEKESISKETLVDGLQSHLASKRKETVIQINSLDQVDAVIVQMLQEMASDDPDPLVREATLKTLNELDIS
jgi:hypothetical protein